MIDYQPNYQQSQPSSRWQKIKTYIAHNQQKTWVVGISSVMLLLAVAVNIIAFWPEGSKDKSKETADISVSPSPISSSSPAANSSPEPSIVPTPSASPKTSPKPTPKPSVSPSPKVTPSLSPSPSSNKTYVLNWSEGTAKITQGQNYGIYAILKYDGEVVKDQSNVKYVWKSDSESIATATPFTGCTNGIQEPCPEDHATIKGIGSGTTKVTVTAYWKDKNELVDDVTFTIEVSASESASPSP